MNIIVLIHQSNLNNRTNRITKFMEFIIYENHNSINKGP